MFLRFLCLIVALFIGVSNAQAQDSKQILSTENDMTAEELLKTLPEDVVIGDKNAPVTIIEYASMTCSHCAAFHNNTFSELKEKFIDTGKVQFIFRDFPLDEPALRASQMARCAAKTSEENFLKFIKVMFSTQSNWAPKKNYLEILSNIGKLGGMKSEEFDLCIADKDLEYSIMNGKFQAAKQLEVRSTPTLFINGEMHKGGRSMAYLSKEINKILGVDEEIDVEAKEEQ